MALCAAGMASDELLRRPMMIDEFLDKIDTQAFGKLEGRAWGQAEVGRVSFGQEVGPSRSFLALRCSVRPTSDRPDQIDRRA